MANINEILARAAALRDETALNSIDPERAGGIMYDTLIALNELWLQSGSALVISKIYSSVAAMNADTNPISDLTGQPLRPGQIVVISSSDSDNGTVYRYNGTSSPRWSVCGTIGGVAPVDNLNSDSSALPLAARQGKVLDGKISRLGQEVEENGYFIADALRNIGFKYDDNGLDFAKISAHAIQVLHAAGIGSGSIVDVEENGFFIVDSQLNIGFAVDSTGVKAKNVLQFEKEQ